MIATIVKQAREAAIKAEAEFRAIHGETMYCGFAWVNVYVTRTNSPEAKEFIAAGFGKDSTKAKCLSLWNPGGSNTQSMDIKEIGAMAFAKVLRNAGFRAYAQSRAD